MPRLIDGDALYEKACDLEAQALDYTVKISNDEEKREEWLRWSAILAERSAFRHDVYDAPTIEPQQTGRWIQIEESIKVSKYKCSECGRAIWDDRGYDPYVDYPYCHCGARMEGE